jgi:cytochrome c-type biogenesis protein CcmH/NrfF
VKREIDRISFWNMCARLLVYVYDVCVCADEGAMSPSETLDACQNAAAGEKLDRTLRCVSCTTRSGALLPPLVRCA